ncbi:MAG: S1 family peptidase [Myxococcota bacterium]
MIGRALLILGLLATPACVAALETEKIFERYEESVVQIRIVEAGSGAKRTIGTGFVVGAGGELATNYHVISDLVLEPELYRAEWVDDDGEGHPVELLGFDVVRDIAVVRAETPFGSPFTLHRGEPRKGERVYAVGDPYDLGMSIVEGLYNGRLEHSRYERIHFTGSLNPGMSGGPALLRSGQVVGVNVASAGNQVSFLVPVEDLRALIDRVAAPDHALAGDRKAALRDQLWRHQEEYFGAILASDVETVRLGPYAAPSRLAPFFNCWGDVHEPDKAVHRSLTHQCDTQDWIYVSEDQHLGVVWLRHRQVESEELSPTRFYELYSQYFEANWSHLVGNDELFTRFVCRTRFVGSNGLVFKTALCARRYLELPGLHDVVFKAAHLGEDRMGLETSLVLTATSLENAEKLARRHLAAIEWVGDEEDDPAAGEPEDEDG